MAWYRMYFVDHLARFRCPCDLDAQSDGEARAMAYALQYACSDVHVGIELWQGARRIPGAFHNTPDALRSSWEQVSASRENDLLKLEQSLFRSGTILSRSRKLAERIEAAGLGTASLGAAHRGRAPSASTVRA
jgi:hypothetical protein